MRRLWWLLFLLTFAPFSAAQTTGILSSGGIGVSCNAVSAATSINPGFAGGCEAFALVTSGGSLPNSYTWTVTTTGSPASISVKLAGSLDGITWTTIDTLTSATSISDSGNYRFLGCIPATMTGGSSPTVSCSVSVSVGSGSGGGGVTGQTKGLPTVGLTATTAGASNEAYKVSAFCGATASNQFTTCPSSTDESTAIVAAENACQGAGTTNSTCRIIDDMCGTQTISVQPFNMAGVFEFGSNCSDSNPHIWNWDGIGTLTTPHSGLTIKNMGGNGFLQSPTNVYAQACNPNIDNCVNGGFLVKNASITSFTVAAGVATVVLGAPGIPASGSGPAVMRAGRLFYVGPDSGTANNRGAWVILTVTDATHLTVGVVSGTTTTCNASCGTGYLDTPMAEVGGSTGGGVFDVEFDHFLFNCHYVIGCGGFVNGVGQENTRFLLTHVANADTYYGRLDTSAAYNGSGTNGSTNSGPYGPWSGNMNPEFCTKTGGCACLVGTANGACAASPVPVGTLMTCGAGTTGSAAIISPDPCDNPNFVGFAFTGVSAPQGHREVLGITSSIQDKTATNTGIAGLMGGTGGEAGSSAATTGSAITVCGDRVTFGDVHTEFYLLAAEVGCNSAVVATWSDYYSQFLTSSISFTGGLWAFQTGGIGLDLGQSGNGAELSDVALNEVTIGNGAGNIIADNVTGNTITGAASETAETYFHGHGTQPTVWGSSPTIGFQSQTIAVLGPTSGVCKLTASATGGTLNICSTNHTVNSNGTVTANYAQTMHTVVDAGSPYTVLASDSLVYCNGSAGTITLNLPAATGSGKVLTLANISASQSCSIVSNGTDTIAGLPHANAYVLTNTNKSPSYVPLQIVDAASGAWNPVVYPATYLNFGDSILGSADISIPNTLVDTQIFSDPRSAINPGPSDEGTTGNIQFASTSVNPGQVKIKIAAWNHNNTSADCIQDVHIPAAVAPFTLTAAANASGGTTAYTGTITNGGSNAYAGTYVVITGFVNGANNSTAGTAFIVTASTTTTLTVNNASGVAETHAGTATQNVYVVAPFVCEVFNAAPVPGTQYFVSVYAATAMTGVTAKRFDSSGSKQATYENITINN